MNRRTFLLGMGTATAGGGALLASGSFSRTASQRDTSVEIVGDDGAYLGIELFAPSVCQGIVDIADVTNRFKKAQTLTDIVAEVVSSPDDISVSVDSTPDQLDTGDTGTVTLDVDCDGATEPKTVALRIEANGDEERVEVHREVDINCACSSTTATGISFVAFSGDGTTALGTDGGNTGLDIDDITVESRNNDGEPTVITWETSEPVDEVILYGGTEWYLYSYPDGATSDTVEMSRDTADDDANGNTVRFSGDTSCRCPPSPGDEEPCLKVERNGAGLDPNNPEATQENCNGKGCL